MDTISYSTFRTHMASILDKVNDNHKPILITRQNAKPAVVMSLEDYQAYEETAYLWTGYWSRRIDHEHRSRVSAR